VRIGERFICTTKRGEAQLGTLGKNGLTPYQKERKRRSWRSKGEKSKQGRGGSRETRWMKELADGDNEKGVSREKET